MARLAGNDLLEQVLDRWFILGMDVTEEVRAGQFLA
jgi:hypothetical protein